MTRLHWAALMLAMGLVPAAQAQETIRIGLVQPLSGSVAYNGTTDVNGAKLAVAQRSATRRGAYWARRWICWCRTGSASPLPR